MVERSTTRQRPLGQTTGSPVRGAQRLVDDVLIFDLASESRQLMQEEIWERNRRNGKTLAKEGRLRVTLTALKAGATMPDEHVGGRTTVQVVEGMVILRTAGREAELTPGRRIAVIDRGIPWNVEAEHQSVVLLTIAWPDDETGGSPRRHERRMRRTADNKAGGLP